MFALALLRGARQLSLGTFRSGAFAWDRSLGIRRLGSFAWDATIHPHTNLKGAKRLCWPTKVCHTIN